MRNCQHPKLVVGCAPELQEEYRALNAKNTKVAMGLRGTLVLLKINPTSSA